MIRKYNLLGKQINNELEKTYLIAKLKNITKKKTPQKFSKLECRFSLMLKPI